MKKLLLICLLAMIPSLAMAGGTDGDTATVTTAGKAVSLDTDYTATSLQKRVFVLCLTSDFTVSAWDHDEDGNEQYMKFTGRAWQDTMTVAMGTTVVIEGKVDFLFLDVAAGSHTVYVYTFMD